MAKERIHRSEKLAKLLVRSGMVAPMPDEPKQVRR
jgi:hypothetical protein